MGEEEKENDSKELVNDLTKALMPLISSLVDDMVEVKAMHNDISFIGKKVNLLSDSFDDIRVEFKNKIEKLFDGYDGKIDKEAFNKELDRIAETLRVLFEKDKESAKKDYMSLILKEIHKDIQDIKNNCKDTGTKCEAKREKDFESFSNIKKNLYIDLGKGTIVISVALTLLIQFSLLFLKGYFEDFFK
jgi:predicted HicB family RNase H-like nuclease